ncbi:hypothetical protein PSCT_03442 [Pseudomonas sp. SCT]|uniref:Panacea domain-containing protein n=1 Tax=Pseudomonas sp. (strain SCT) TaxID=412955 RepID=UPI000EE9523E|nr:Panacea domain-containing protein [Pseudomonas sp. SCT]GCA57233.1 hypothetical protein PSCT_03442 [Pseudomonas sp. SCT]
MNKVQEIAAYFCSQYPYKGELSKARLTKLVYLADWFSALVDDAQLTDIEWVFNHYGPYVDDVVDETKRHEDFEIEDDWTAYGSRKQIIKYYGDTSRLSLNRREIQILDEVINRTKRLYFNDFIDYVYSTYPVQAKERYTKFNLPALAREYKEEQNL